MGLILAILVIFGIGLGLSKQGDDFIRKLLYSPVAIIVVLFLGVEYLILKGRDRTRILKIELDQARRKKQEDLEFMRRAEANLGLLEKEAEALLQSAAKNSHETGDLEGREAAGNPDIQTACEQILQKLRDLRRGMAQKL